MGSSTPIAPSLYPCPPPTSSSRPSGRGASQAVLAFGRAFPASFPLTLVGKKSILRPRAGVHPPTPLWSVACEGLDPLAPDGAPAPGRPQGMACKWRPPGPKANSPNQDDYPEKDREFNRYTLLREYDLMFLPLLKEQCHQVGTIPTVWRNTSVPILIAASSCFRNV